MQAGLSPALIRAAGGGATQFTIAAGNPTSAVTQWDFGGFAQDDWKVQPNLMLSFGLRYENQDNINSNFNYNSNRNSNRNTNFVFVSIKSSSQSV